MAAGSFATGIACIDGRVQLPIINWLRAFAGVDYVDMVTEPGPDAALNQASAELLSHLRQSVEISVRAHGSRVVAVAGHHDCAAYSVSREQHLAGIQAAARVIASWGLPVRVVGLWVNDRWEVEVVSDSGAGGA